MTSCTSSLSHPFLSKGAIVYVSSVGAYQPFGLIGGYSLSKTALLALTKLVANECECCTCHVPD